jgi:aldehyde:ferredoxin oxidoreductase
MMGGYIGKLLRIRLSDLKVSVESLDFEVARKLVGGDGYAANILYNEVTSSITPYSTENRLIFMTGPLTGSMVPGGNRWAVVARSPLTDIFGESHAGGFWGTELKSAGFDGVIVQGRAESPVYLWIHDKEVEIRKADDLWGMETFEAYRTIQSELGDQKTRIIGIGPAGEKLVRIAAIICSDRGAAGRTGLGAVMGSKNLKAIAVRGTGKIPIVDENRVRELLGKVREALKVPPLNAYDHRNLGRDGTAYGVETFNVIGNLPTKNWTVGSFAGAEKISGPTMSKTILSRRTACFNCPISCGRYIEVKAGPYSPLSGPGPEYEAIASFGSLCMNENLESIAKANDICNRLGTDTISCGASIAFAMECYEKGTITPENTGGVKLSWGNHEAIIRMTELIGRKEGFGATLGEGVRIAAQKIGKGAENCAIHVKGLEIPMHNPRILKAQGLGYATSNRGACHNQGSPMYVERGVLLPDYGFDKSLNGIATEGKARLTMIHQNICTAVDAMGMCKFVVLLTYVIPPTLLAEFYSAVTGLETDHNELLRLGERIWNLKRAFNIEMGLSRQHDTLPKRFLEETVQEGPAKGQIVELEPMLNVYYALRGWDCEGRPTKEKLRELGLEGLIDVDSWPSREM